MIFYILNAEQELVETIQSPDTEGTGGITALNGIVDEKLDTYELLEITVPADADGLENIHEEMSIIFEDISGWREYSIYEIEDVDGGTFETSIRAELSSSELIDEIIEKDISGVSRDPETILNSILEGTRYNVGHVDSSLYSQAFNLNTTYMNVLEVLNEFAVRFDGEIRFSYQVDGNKVVNRFVNVYKTYGEYRGKIFEIDRDMTGVKRTVNTELIKTTIIPYSKELEVDPEDSENNETYRLDISDVVWSKANGDPVNKPKGQNYLVNQDALMNWGTLQPDGTRRHRKISMEFDLEDVESIASMAWVQLGRYTQPRVTYEVDGIDLYAMTRDPDLEHEKILLGDTAGVKDLYFSRPIEIQTRLVEVLRDLFDSRNNQYTFGTSKQLFSANASVEKAEEMIKDVESLIKDVGDFQTIIDGTTKVYRGSNNPVNPNENDLWFRPHPSKQGHTQMLLFNGVSWEIQADSSELEDASRLKFGTLDGAEINVINLIADNITGGQLKLEKGIEITNKGIPILKTNSAGEVVMNVSKLEINAVDMEEELNKKATQKQLTDAINAVELKPGPEGKTAYDIAVENGFTGTKVEWIASLAGKQGQSGKTAYELAVEQGFQGTLSDWLNSLEGEAGLPGQGIESIKNYYYLSTSKTEQVDGVWEDEPQEWEYGKYLWTKSTITYKNPREIEETVPVVSAEWEAVNQLEIDGRNLIPSFKNDTWYLNPDYKEVAVEGGEEVEQMVRLSFVRVMGPYELYMSDDADFAGEILINASEDTDYTLSFNAVGGMMKVESLDVSVDVDTGETIENIITSNDAIKNSPYTFNTERANTIRVSMIRETNEDGSRRGGSAHFRKIKLEKQPKASDWSPAPEDLGIDAETIDKIGKDLSEQGTTVKENELAIQEAVMNLAGVNKDLDALVNLNIEDQLLGITSNLQKFSFSDEGLVIRPNLDDSATKIVMNSAGIHFYNGSQDENGLEIPVASIEEQELRINKGIFMENLKIAGHSFEEGAPRHTEITWTGAGN